MDRSQSWWHLKYFNQGLICCCYEMRRSQIVSSLWPKHKQRLTWKEKKLNTIASAHFFSICMLRWVLRLLQQNTYKSFCCEPPHQLELHTCVLLARLKIKENMMLFKMTLYSWILSHSILSSKISCEEDIETPLAEKLEIRQKQANKCPEKSVTEETVVLWHWKGEHRILY